MNNLSAIIKTIIFYLLVISFAILITFTLTSFIAANIEKKDEAIQPKILLISGLVIAFIASFIRQKFGEKLGFKKGANRIFIFIWLSALLLILNFVGYFLFGNILETYWIFSKSTLKAEIVFDDYYPFHPDLAKTFLGKLPLAPQSMISSDGKLSFNLSGPHEYGWTCIDTCPYYYVVTVNKINGDIVGTYHIDEELSFWEGLDVADDVRWSSDSRSLYLIPSTYDDGQRIVYAIHKLSIPEVS